MTQKITLEEAAALLWQEADLLDHREYDAWLNLWSDDGIYVVPIEKGVEDFANRLNYAYDDGEMRRMRVARLKSSYSMSAIAAADTIRTVSRFVVTGERSNEIDIRAAQILVEYRRDKTRPIAANVDVTVRRTENGLKLVKKVIWLAHSEEAVSGVGYLL
ncbi:aromatic-ring-hydroxylating dioxygenase subunit beta [Kordiimonas pumila]|uniref:Aromatic-ring-hydroxylating dioxygenase subunit beta n=1 Tax=Kordiimonas pumila TaxID=2161677 RepID=A0ABV7D4A3_9PROT|nr:aromatic-ring-hydroxylating dioxygenase subunit beta [Kordiimonas pumila]